MCHAASLFLRVGRGSSWAYVRREWESKWIHIRSKPNLQIWNEFPFAVNLSMCKSADENGRCMRWSLQIEHWCSETEVSLVSTSVLHLCSTVIWESARLFHISHSIRESGTLYAHKRNGTAHMSVTRWIFHVEFSILCSKHSRSDFFTLLAVKGITRCDSHYRKTKKYTKGNTQGCTLILRAQLCHCIK